MRIQNGPPLYKVQFGPSRRGFGIRHPSAGARGSRGRRQMMPDSALISPRMYPDLPQSEARTASKRCHKSALMQSK